MSEKIAVIGLSALFPEADNADQFWQNLLDQKDCTRQVSAKEMGVDPELFHGEPGEADKTYCLNGGFIGDINLTADDLSLSQAQIDGLDDSYRWSLYTAREALKDSGYLGKADTLERCGVIYGNLSFPTKSSNQLFIPLYHQALNKAAGDLLQDATFSLPRYTEAKPAAAHNGLISGYPASLISHALGLQGTQFTLDAACASSLYSVQLACDYLRTGQADLMLAGAVSAADPLFVTMGFSIFQAYPENNISAPLDKRSQGLFAGEGSGALVLKRHSDAVADGDEIYATILGGGLSNDGKGQFVLSPNSKGQVLSYERAYKSSNVDPASVNYIECHATGTPLGDKVELTSMERFFEPHQHAPMIGSVKSNLGHLLTAAGMPGLIKTIYGMRHGKIPATIKVEQPTESPKQFIGSNQIVTDTQDWPAEEGAVKRAGISVFGFGGCNAHLVLEEPRQIDAIKEAPVELHEPLAIVGMDSFFGDYQTLHQLDQASFNGANNFRELPTKRWKGLEQEQAIVSALNNTNDDKTSAPKGGYIDSFDFDFMHFKIPPNDEDRLIPQQLLLLKVADRALQDANIEPGSNVAVLVGMGTELELHQFRGRVNLQTQFDQAWANSDTHVSAEARQAIEERIKNSIHGSAKLNQYTSLIGNIMASRVSSLWDFSGPAFTISAEENSVFRCVEVAQLLLHSSDVDAVLVAGIDLAGSMENQLLRSQFGPLNPLDDDHSNNPFAFDKTNKGWTAGEGAGAVVFKRQQQALKQQQRIYSTLDAIAFSNGVDDNAVNSAANLALQQAQIEPAQVGYIELNASGFSELDQAELSGLSQCYQNKSTEDHKDLSCAIGSVKAHIGHTFNASGIASLIRSSLCLHNRYLPGIPGWSAIKPAASGQTDTPFYALPESKPWLRDDADRPRTAAISNLGMDGSSCHILLSECEQQATGRTNHYLQQEQSQLIPLAFANQQQLQRQLQQLEEKLELLALPELASWAHDQYQKSSEQPFAATLIATSQESLLKEIRALSAQVNSLFSSTSAQQAEWSSPAGSYCTVKPLGDKAKLSYVYPGAFNSYLGLGKELFQLFPELHDFAANQSSRLATLMGDEIFYPRSMNALSHDSLRDRARSLTSNPINMFENGISFAVTYTDLLREVFKVQPDAAFGYSMGEVSMMYALDAWGKTDAMSDTLRSTPVFTTRLAGPMKTLREAWDLPTSTPDNSFWAGYTLRAEAAKVQQTIGDNPYVRMILINTPNSVVIAGKPDACQAIISELGCEAAGAALGDVIHCDLVRPEYDGLANLHRMPVNPITDVNFFTAVGYQPFQPTEDNVAHNIAEMYCNRVDFPRLVNTVYDAGHQIFLELGPRDTCSQYIDATLGNKPHVSIATNRKGSTDLNALLRALAKLMAHRVPMDISRLYSKTDEAEGKKRSLIKAVTLGGERFYSQIVNQENRALLGQPQSAPSIEPAQNTPLTPTPIQPAAQQPNLKISDQLGQLAQQVEQTLQNQNIYLSATGTNHPSAASAATQEQSTQPTSASAGAVTGAAVNNKKTHAGTPTKAQQQVEQFERNIKSLNQTHGKFLHNRQQSLSQAGKLIELQLQALSGATPGSTTHTQEPAVINVTPTTIEPVIKQTPIQPTPPSAPKAAAQPVSRRPQKPKRHLAPAKVAPRADREPNCIWDQKDLTVYAEGNIADVFGQDYAIIDSYKRRVRLPTTEYLLVSRVTELDAEMGNFSPCSMTTEYDIPKDAWYAIDSQIPWAVSVESGQCDLMLISYLGIDFQNKGDRVYRLLDCTLTFIEDIPTEGDTLRYEISINSFAKQGDTLLFFFSYECFVGDTMVIKMDGGAAGFFTDEELDAGKGVIETEEEKIAKANIVKQSFTPLLPHQQTAFDEQAMLQLCQGDIESCLGASHLTPGRNTHLVFSAEKMLMIERITQIDPKGGAWGLGLLVGEKTLAPDHWYFPCHFKDDEVMAGSLMSDGCGQLLRFFSLYLGLHTTTQNARFQPLPNEPQQVRCRGQVTPQHGTLTYRMEVTEIGMEPYPYAKANVDILLNGKIVVDFKNLGLFLKEYPEDGTIGPMGSMPATSSTPSVPDIAQPATISGINSAALTQTMMQVVAEKTGYPTDMLELDMDMEADLGIDSIKRVEILGAVQEAYPELPEPDTDALAETRTLQQVVDYLVQSAGGATTATSVTETQPAWPINVPDIDLPLAEITLPQLVPGLYDIRKPPFKPFPGNPSDRNCVPDTVPFTWFHFTEFATGRVANCFGEECGCYDGRTPPRTPNADLQLTTRVIDVQGERHNFKKEAFCIAQFDCPADAWFFEQNTHEQLMPYSILMEIALQPCGFISAWAGSTLTSPEKDLFFRNLDGSGKLLRNIDLRGKTIENKSTLTSTTILSGTIIQNFTFELSVEGELFYVGTAVFGYFQKDALTHQLGMDKGKITQGWHLDNAIKPEQLITVDLVNDQRLFQQDTSKPYYHLAGPQLQLVDQVTIVEGGGKAGKGYIYAERNISESDWFFACHFHQDPVMPGSLGVEAMFQILQTYALQQGLGRNMKNPRFNHIEDEINWKYRGQITPINKKMSLDLHITALEISDTQVKLVADGNLSKDGLRIYELKDLIFCIEEA